MSSKSSKQSKKNQPLENLRNQLLKLEPAGQQGFEGLVATALAELTGLTFRLAKSGSQFGRDARTPRARFAIAMEESVTGSRSDSKMLLEKFGLLPMN